jgi:hypothetical protein
MGVLFSDGANPASQAKTTGNVRQLSAEVPPCLAWHPRTRDVSARSTSAVLRAVALPETMVHGPGPEPVSLERLNLH